jgi:hypothetical protein
LLHPTCLAFDEQVAGAIADDPIYAMLVCLFDLVGLLASDGKFAGVKNFANDSTDISLERSLPYLNLRVLTPCTKS